MYTLHVLVCAHMFLYPSGICNRLLFELSESNIFSLGLGRLAISTSKYFVNLVNFVSF